MPKGFISHYDFRHKPIACYCDDGHYKTASLEGSKSSITLAASWLLWERLSKIIKPKKRYRKKGIVFIVFGGLYGGWLSSLPAYAQTLSVRTDGVTDTTIIGSRDCSADCIITGDSRSGSNLFHSFEKFSLADGVTATFDDEGATNIFANVSDEISIINGRLSVTGPGSANLFLLNRHGIIFGANAALSIAGSFVASTAENVAFSDGLQFGARNISEPLLTVSTPIGAPVGLQFGSHPGEITNYSQAGLSGVPSFFPKPAGQPVGQPIGLEVSAGQTLALVGSQINLAGGSLTAKSGRIELGSVAADSLVSVSSNLHMGLHMGYENVSKLADVQLTQSAQIDVSGDRGFVSIRSRNLSLADDSLISNQIVGAELPGSIELIADETIELDSSAIYFFRTLGTFGEGVALDIAANRLVLKNGSLLLGATLSGLGDAGNITISALDSVALFGASRETTNYITASSNSSGAGGDITINTRRLWVSDGSQIESVAGSTGEGGDIVINATNSVEVRGQAPISTAPAARRLLTFVGLDFEHAATEPSVSRISATSGLAEVDSAQSTSRGGSLTVNTGLLSMSDRAQVTVGSFGRGDSGDLKINAHSVRLDSGAQLSAAANLANGGNLRLEGLETLILRRGSSLSTSAGVGDGGNIWIDADFVIAQAFEDSDIVAKATGGRSGNIIVDTFGVYGIAPRRAIANNGTSDIDASSEFGVSGTTAITQVPSAMALGLPLLTAQPLDVSTTVTHQCGASGNSFIVSARGGVPLAPASAVAINSPLVDLGDEAMGLGYRAIGAMNSEEHLEESSTPAIAVSTVAETGAIETGAIETVVTETRLAETVVDDPSWVEARSWHTDESGQVVLSAQPKQSSDVSFVTPGYCAG